MATAEALRAILLDLDGTLYHQFPVRLGVISRLLLAHARTPSDGLRTIRMLRSYRRMQEQLRHGAVPEGSLLHAAQLDLASRGCGETSSAMEHVVKHWMEEVPQPMLKWARRRGLHRFLGTARTRGIKLGVVSDYPAERKLESLGVRALIDVVVCAQDESVQRFKPDPRGIVIALERLGIAPESAVYVGDRRDVDIPAAERAGVRGILLRSAPSVHRPSSQDVSDYDALHDRLFSGVRGDVFDR